MQNEFSSHFECLQIDEQTGQPFLLTQYNLCRNQIDFYVLFWLIQRASDALPIILTLVSLVDVHSTANVICTLCEFERFELSNRVTFGCELRKRSNRTFETFGCFF